jgi:hypothetical protein
MKHSCVRGVNKTLAPSLQNVLIAAGLGADKYLIAYSVEYDEKMSKPTIRLGPVHTIKTISC